jgi:membrane fusion protein, multidrug efflux system
MSRWPSMPLIVLSALSASLLVEGCSSQPAAGAATQIAASAAADATPTWVAAEYTEVTSPLLLPSHLYVQQDAVLAARAPGVLKRLTVDLGQSVRAGEVIAQVEDDAQRMALSRATVSWERANQVATRARAMKASNGIADAELEDAEFALRDADVTRREAEFAAERTTVVAPFDGVVTARYVQPGRLLALNDSVVRITARGPLLARVRLPEEYASTLSTGREVSVRTATPGARAVGSGRVLRVAPAIDAASGTREVILEVRTNGATLLPGMSIAVEIPGERTRRLTVPRAAITADGYVIVQQDRRDVMRQVVLGDTLGDRVEIRAGLGVGERLRATAAPR